MANQQRISDCYVQTAFRMKGARRENPPWWVVFVRERGPFGIRARGIIIYFN